MKLHMFGKTVVMALLVLGLIPAGAAAQQAPAKKDAAKLTSPTAGYLEIWKDTGRKLIEMAEDFPEDKYDYKPMKDSRTFPEQLLHAAGTVYYFQAIMAGQKPPDDPKVEDYKTRAALVAYVKKAVADGAAMLEKSGDAGFTKPMLIGTKKRPDNPYKVWADLCEHTGEHYGQMVVYYRNNGLVPPESRPKK